MEVLDSPTFANNFITEQEEAHKNPASRRGYPFPLTRFMKTTGGVRKGWQVFILGMAKAGKTSFMITYAMTLGRIGASFCYFAMEEGTLALGNKVFAAEALISKTKFRDVNLEKGDWPLLVQARDRIAKYNAHWVYGADTVQTMTDVVNSFDPDIVFIDYLQLMMPVRQLKSDNKTQEVSENSRALRKLANGDWPGLKVKRPRAVIVAAQLNDKGEILWSRDPDRDADLVVSIDPLDDGYGTPLPDQRRITIRRFRHGETDHFNVSFAGEHSLIKEPSTTTGNIKKP